MPRLHSPAPNIGNVVSVTQAPLDKTVIADELIKHVPKEAPASIHSMPRSRRAREVQEKFVQSSIVAGKAFELQQMDIKYDLWKGS